MFLVGCGRRLVCCLPSVIFGCLLSVGVAGVGLAEEPRQQPHIVVILVDDMGFGDPQCYNAASKIPTPHIDSIARQGMKFTDAHSAGPLCHMSRYGLLTGIYPFRTDVSRWPEHALIAPNQFTIASLLKGQGYHTAMVGKWHLGFNENGYEKPLPGGPVDCGFDSFFGIRASTDIPPYFYISGDRAVTPPTDQIAANNSPGWSPIQGAFWRSGGIAPDLDLSDVLPRFTDEATEVIRQHAGRDNDQPLFLYLAYPAPHTPWLPSEEFVGTSKASMYGDFLVMVDAMIGRVLTTLEQQDMTDDTLLIFSSDNGPTWYERDVERFGHDSSGGLRGMKADAWEGGHRVPFLVRWPGQVEPGSVCDQTICFTDMLATFAAVTGTTLDSETPTDSINMLPLLKGSDQALRTSLAMASGNGTMTYRKGPWKLITGLGSGGFSAPARIRPGPGDPAGQLYNLDEDLAESNNLYAQYPSVVEDLSSELAKVVNAESAADGKTESQQSQ